MTGPRHDETWRKVAATSRPGWGFFAIVAVLSLGLGALLSAWALRLL